MAKPDESALSAEDVAERIAASGYPFEYEVYNKLQARTGTSGGWTLEYGARAQTGREDESTKDVDILARRIVIEANRRLEMFLYIETKRLFGQAFVGFVAPAELTGRTREARLRAAFLGGFPGPTDERATEKVMCEPGGLAFKLAETLDAPLCAQWAVARAKGGNPNQKTADQPQGFRDDIVSNIRAGAWRADMLSRDETSNPRFHVDVQFYFPIVVVDGPVFTYAPTATKKVETVDRLILRASADTVGGTRFAAVDIVTANAFPRLMDQLDAFSHLARAEFDVDGTSQVLAGAASVQRDDYLNRIKPARRFFEGQRRGRSQSP